VLEGGGHETEKIHGPRLIMMYASATPTCRAAAPKVFGADSNGQSVVADPEAESLETVLEAAASCDSRGYSVLTLTLAPTGLPGEEAQRDVRRPGRHPELTFP